MKLCKDWFIRIPFTRGGFSIRLNFKVRFWKNRKLSEMAKLIYGEK